MDPSGAVCSVLRPTVALLTLFFVPFALANTATFYDARPDSPSPTAMPHAKVALAHQATRTILAFLSGVLPHFVHPDNYVIAMHFWAVLMTITSFCLLASYVWLQPYYNHKLNVLCAMLMALVFWTSASMTFSGISNQYDGHNNDYAVFYYGGVFLIFPLALVVLLWRKQSLLSAGEHRKIRGHSSSGALAAVEIELEIRFLLRAAHDKQKLAKPMSSLSLRHQSAFEELDLETLQDAVT